MPVLASGSGPASAGGSADQRAGATRDAPARRQASGPVARDRPPQQRSLPAGRLLQQGCSRRRATLPKATPAAPARRRRRRPRALQSRQGAGIGAAGQLQRARGGPGGSIFEQSHGGMGRAGAHIPAHRSAIQLPERPKTEARSAAWRCQSSAAMARAQAAQEVVSPPRPSR